MVAQSVSSDDKSKTNHQPHQRPSPSENNKQTRQTLIGLASSANNLNGCSSLCSDTSTGQMDSECVSAELHDLRVTMLQPSEHLRVTYLKCFVRNLLNRKSSVANIATILLRTECWLSDVVCLQNVELTQDFLKEKDAASNDDTDCFVPAEVVLLRNLRLKTAFGSSTIDGDSQASVDRVLTSSDVQSAQIILKYGPEKAARLKYFFSNIVSMATTRLDLKALKLWLTKIIEWNILNEEASRLVEQQVFQKATKEAIQVFLECQFEAHIEKLFKRNALTSIFGNPNVNIGFLNKLEFEVNARGSHDFTALHYAVQNNLVDKVKFLLDCGAETNAINWKNETPLVLTLREPQVNQVDKKKCAEILLQYGADPFIGSWEGQSFDSCIQLSDGYMTELALAYARIHKSAGAANLSADNANALSGIDNLVRQNNDLFSFYMKCKYQLRSLKNDVIRKNETMFTIISKTGSELLRLLDEKDRRVVSDFIERYRKENTLNIYYLNALQEHMRQFRKLQTYQNRAMLVISEHAKVPVSRHKVLKKVISEFTSKDLLMFQ